MDDINLIVSQQTMDMKMDIKMDSKYYLAIITFIIGCLLGSYSSLGDGNSGSKGVESELDSSDEITKTYLADTELAPLEKPENSIIQQRNVITGASSKETISAIINAAPLYSRHKILNVDYEDPKAYWHNILFQSEFVDEKLSAIDELIHLQDSDLLASGLGDKSAEIRKATIEGLELIGDANSVQLLGQALFYEKDQILYSRIIEALETLSYHDNAQAFLDFLTKKDT